MEDAEIPFKHFEENLKRVDDLANIGTDVGNLSIQFLEALAKQNEELPGFISYKQKLERTIDVIKEIKKQPGLMEKYKIVYSQSLVLVVSNFESFLNELAVIVFDRYGYLINWPDKKFSLDLAMFQYSVPTAGEIVLRSLKEKYNFQDLKSTLDFFKDYIEIEIEMHNELRDKVILFQAQRHLIIHNLSKVDDRYLKQVRNTQHRRQYSKDDVLVVNEDDYKDAKACFLDLATTISGKVVGRVLPF